MFFTSVAIPVQADTGAGATATQTPNPAVPEEIIVTGNRLFPDLSPELELDQRDIAGYGVSTVDELLGDVQAELGADDEQPLILVNGERINSLDEIGAFPVEAVNNVQVLPRNSAVRLGGRPRQRVISINLRKKVRTGTVTAARRIATEGDWHGTRGEGIFTYVQGATRGNLALRGRGESMLLESERGIDQPLPGRFYALGGNVVGYPNPFGEIDPLLSADAGEAVTVAPVPDAAFPTLGDFSANANDPAFTDLAEFRSVKPETRNYDLNGTFATPLSSRVTISSSVRFNRGHSSSIRGLPAAWFVLSPDNPASPFSTDVGLLYYGQRPFENRSERSGGEGNVTLNGRFGRWTANLNLRHSESKDEFRTERLAEFGPVAIDDGYNPFSNGVDDLIAIRRDRAISESATNYAQLNLNGPAAHLPAGDILTTLEGRLAFNRLEARSTYSTIPGRDVFHRSEQAIRIAAEVPLVSRANGFLPALGELSATAEFSRIHFSDAGTLSNHALGLIWEPVPAFRLAGTLQRTERPASIQILGNPVIQSPGVRVFDPLRDDPENGTVDVVQITGGNPDLHAETTKTKQLTALWRLIPRLNLQLNAEYTDTDVQDFLSSLPEASAPVMLAFPDRFLRDPSGTLIAIDLRPVNFDSHREKRVRYGFSLNAPLGGGQPVVAARSQAASDDDDAPEPAPKAQARRVGPTPRLQLTANHSIVFVDEIRIRPGLGTVDLLEGGAVGIAAGSVRHQLDATAAITSGGLGARLGVAWRGASSLETVVGGETDKLRFSPYLLLNFRAFTDARRLFGEHSWTRSMRLSVNVINALNDRQRVRNSLGLTPLQYQPGYRDAVGRTVEFEIRKVF
ncbi:MAG: hypothetical protein ACJ8EY_03270 [Sphingomicrobium sp.]